MKSNSVRSSGFSNSKTAEELRPQTNSNVIQMAPHEFYSGQFLINEKFDRHSRMSAKQTTDTFHNTSQKVFDFTKSKFNPANPRNHMRSLAHSAARSQQVIIRNEMERAAKSALDQRNLKQTTSQEVFNCYENSISLSPQSKQTRMTPYIKFKPSNSSALYKVSLQSQPDVKVAPAPNINLLEESVEKSKVFTGDAVSNQRQQLYKSTSEVQVSLKFSKFKMNPSLVKSVYYPKINEAYFQKDLDLRQKSLVAPKPTDFIMKIFSSEAKRNVYTNTKSFAKNNQNASLKTRVLRYSYDSQEEIGPAHQDLDSKCLLDLARSSERNTDIIFGPKDRHLHSELADPFTYQPLKEVIRMSSQLSREQASKGKFAFQSDWLRLKTANDEIRERNASDQIQRNMYSIAQYDKNEVQNEANRIPAAVPMDFNLLGVGSHKQLLKLSCDLLKEQLR